MNTKEIITLIQSFHPGTTLNITKTKYEILDKDGDCLVRLQRKMKMDEATGLEILENITQKYWPQWILDLIKKNGFTYKRERMVLRIMKQEIPVIVINLKIAKMKKLVRKHINTMGSLSKMVSL